MAVSSVGNNYNAYTNYYSDISKESSQTAKTGTASASQTTEEYLSYLRRKYSDVNITVADFSSDRQLKSYMLSCSGYNNIAISSSMIEKMASDPATAAKYEKIIADVPDQGKQFKKEVEATGSELIACGTVIDKNGNVSYWGISRTETENPGTGYKEKVQKQLEEKRAEKKKKEKAEKKKAERKEAQEKQQEIRMACAESKEVLLKKIRTGETEKMISNGDLTGVRIDYSV